MKLNIRFLVTIQLLLFVLSRKLARDNKLMHIQAALDRPQGTARTAPSAARGKPTPPASMPDPIAYRRRGPPRPAG